MLEALKTKTMKKSDKEENEVFSKKIHDFLNYIQSNFDDNYITEEEFNLIQHYKKVHDIPDIDIYEIRETEVYRILYQQLYLLLLDDQINLEELKELDFYQQIFNMNADEILKIEETVRDEKILWKERMYGTHTNFSIETRHRNIPESIKKIVWDRDGGKCVLCGSTINLEFDHEIPFSLGGSNRTENIRVLCKDCNRKKSAKIGLTDEE